MAMELRYMLTKEMKNLRYRHGHVPGFSGTESALIFSSALITRGASNVPKSDGQSRGVDFKYNMN